MTTVRTRRVLHGGADVVGEFAGRQFGRIELRDEELPGVAQGGEVEAERLGAVEQQAHFLVEDEHRGLAAPADRLR